MRTTPDDLLRIPMSWDDYLALDDPRPSEYYGGAQVIQGSPTFRHQKVIQRLERHLGDGLADGTDVIGGWAWSPDGSREALKPDLMVITQDGEDDHLTVPPLLVVEVVSSNRKDDYVAKTQRYAQWGAPTYWIVDPRDRVIVTFRNDGGTFVESARHTDGAVVLAYGDVEVPVDLDALFA
ncbi:Uma2 family endonuclease [Nocardioides humilatus]|nr:Uma2 family endonuclease [Nocardioides humilatus]